MIEQPTHAVHLRRTEENVDEITVLSDRHGGAAGIEAVLSNLNRQATATKAPGRVVSRAFQWEDRDNRSERWWPQGITWSTDVGAPQGVLATSAYAKDGLGRTIASRITVVDMATLRYRHVLLVQPVVRGDEVSMRPLKVHAGGLVWVGPTYLHVAGTRRGILTCRMEDVLEVEPSEETLGHRYVLPVRFQYDAGAGDMRYSFLSLDRSAEPHELVAGEYGRGSMTTRLVRYPLDGDHLRSGEDGLSVPSHFDERGIGHMQGAVTVAGTWYVTRSRGRFGLGHLLVGTPGSFRTHRLALPVGPEDITYWPGQDRLWSLTEYPGRRFVVAMDRRQFD